MLKKLIGRVFEWGGVILLFFSAANIYPYEYTVINAASWPLSLRINTTGAHTASRILQPGEEYTFVQGGASSGLCLTSIEQDAGGPRSTKKGKQNEPKDWSNIKFSLGKDLKIAAGTGGAIGGVAGSIGGAIVAGSSTLIIPIGGGLFIGEASAAAAGAVFIGAIGAAAVAALGVSIGAMAMFCRSYTGNSGLMVYENDKGQLRWTFFKKK